MNLHRTSGKPDWVKVSPDDRNLSQRVAFWSHGVITPGNVISIIGLALVIYGLWLIVEIRFIEGLVWVVVGRILDLVDGVVAQATGTKSPIGEMVDAIADKLATFLTVAVLVYIDISSWWIVSLLVVPQLIISAISFVKKWAGVKVQPTRAGKVSMMLTWLGIVSLFLAIGSNKSDLLMVLTYLLVGLSVVTSIVAAGQYYRASTKVR